MSTKKIFSYIEVIEQTGLSRDELDHLIERDLIQPFQTVELCREFDDEDISRIRLILELKDDFGVNEEGVPVVLHLIDQIHFLQGKIRELLIAKNE